MRTACSEPGALPRRDQVLALGPNGTNACLAVLVRRQIRWRPSRTSGFASLARSRVQIAGSGTVEAVSAKTGAQLWQFSLGASGPGATAPALAGAVVYAVSSAGTIYALNPPNGKKLWSLASGEPVLSSPVIANGVLFLGNGSYGIDAFGVR
jgi:outer membrane protein assembly factor BamB